MSKLPKMWCPAHQCKLMRKETRYGGRWDCPQAGCTVMCWEGPTSTPADQETRDARKLTHLRFDALWKERGLSRSWCYANLAKWMKLPREKAHIGMFDVEQCREAYRFCFAVEKGEIKGRS